MIVLRGSGLLFFFARTKQIIGFLWKSSGSSSDYRKSLAKIFENFGESSRDFFSFLDSSEGLFAVKILLEGFLIFWLFHVPFACPRFLINRENFINTPRALWTKNIYKRNVDKNVLSCKECAFR